MLQNRLAGIFFVAVLALYMSPVRGNDNSRLLLINTNIIDVERQTLIESQSVLIVDGKIRALANSPDELKARAHTQIDLSGHYLLPGLFDMHVHLATSPSGADQIDVVKHKLAFLLKGGITGVRDMAGDVRQLSYLARQAMLDEISSPNIYYSALMAGVSFFDDPRTHSSARGMVPGDVPWMRAVSENRDYALLVAEARGSGASGIKLYADLPKQLTHQIIQAAHAQGMPVWGHAAVIPALPTDVVLSGIDSVSHAPLLAWSSTDVTPTSGKQRYQDFPLNPSSARYQSLLKNMASREVYLDATIGVYKDKDAEFVYSNGVTAAKQAHLAGVPFVVGTDVGIDPKTQAYPALIDEMLLLHTEVGLSPIQVLRAATLHAARLLRIDQQVGTVSVGKYADLVVLSENPMRDLNHLKSIKLVLKNGVKIAD